MSVISTTNVNPLAPINRTSEITPLITRFNQSSRDIYGKFSIYDNQANNSRTEPFLFTDLNQSDSIKLAKKNDSQSVPFRSAINDVQRMTRFLRSGRGILFSAKQFLIQNQNAFNETRVWNPASILTAAASTPLLRIRPIRHIETGGAGILTNFLRGSIGLSPALIPGDTPIKSKPSGTATGKVISKNADVGSSNPNKGLVRFDTAISGQNNFNLRYGDNSGSENGFFSKIVKNFLRTLPFVGALPKNADWKIRPEYSGRGVYDQLINDKNDLLSFKNRVGDIQKVDQVHTFTSSSLYLGELKNTSRNKAEPSLSGSISDLAGIKDNLAGIKDNKTAPERLDRFTFDTKKTLEQLYNGGEDGTQSSNLNDQVLNNAIYRFNRENKKNGKKYNYEKIDKSFYTKSIIPYNKIGQNRVDRSESFESESLEKKRGFSSVGKPDEINVLFPLQGNEIPGALQSSDGRSSKDLIYFYFFDIANKIYLPFRATLESISDNTAAEYEDFQYIGRADKLFIYKGFSRDLNFNFTAHANSVFELQPMWHRINYLTGLTRPPKYTKNTSTQQKSTAGQFSGEFMVPPLVKLRIGDLYVDLPIVIRSVGVTIPETAIWELTRGEKYSYRGINAVAATAQLPMTCQLQINAAVLEKERAEGGIGNAENSKTRFFGKDVTGFNRQRVKNLGLEQTLNTGIITLPVNDPSIATV